MWSFELHTQQQCKNDVCLSAGTGCFIPTATSSNIAVSESHPWRKAGRFLMFPSCLESQVCQFDPILLYKNRYNLLMFFCLVLLLFLSYPFRLLALSSLTSFSLNLHFPKSRLLCMALVLVCLFERLGDTLVGGMCSVCCQMALLQC